MSYNSKYSGSEVDALLDKVNNGIPLATSSTNGGIKIGYTANNKNYPVVLDSNGKAYVNVPWSDLDTKYDVATQTSNGLMSSDDKKKLDGLSNYTLPTTAASTLGGIKVGYTNNGKNYKVQVDTSGNAFVNVPWTDNNTTYSVATSSTDGLMSKTDKSKLDDIATGANNYTLPKSTSSALGGIMIGYNTSGKNYAVVLDSSGKAYVNVPWTDTDTTYSVATTSANGLMSSSDKSKLNVVFASTTATSVASLNANYQTIKVTLSANGTLSMSATGSSMNGRSVTAYILASGADRTVTIPTSGNYISMCGSSLTIPSGKWAELNMVCVDGIWHIAKMEQE